MKNDLVRNVGKRCPIVLCLDISPSMSCNNRIENLNQAIKVFRENLKAVPKVYNSVEVAIVTFSTTIVEDTEFEPLDSLNDRVFTVVNEGGTNLSAAILKAISKIEDRVAELKRNRIGSYFPFLILVTDGDPDKTDDVENFDRAISAVLKHCELNESSTVPIAPYIIGVGEQVSEETLNKLAVKFTEKAIILDDDTANKAHLFEELFDFIVQSITVSMTTEGNVKALYENIRTKAKSQNELLTKKRHKKLL